MPDGTLPSILWIQTDEQRTDSLGCYGNSHIHTPNFDALAARGTVFLDHHTQSPVCVPSRVCELTSCYPHQTGILDNSVHYTWGRWPEGLLAFPEHFAAAGYATVSMGKYHTPHHPTWLENWHFEWFPNEAHFFGLAERFDEREHEIIHVGNRRDRGVIVSGRYPDAPGGRTPQSYLVDHALDWLGMFAHVRRPFLMRVSFLAPHTPVLAPDPFYSMYDPAEMDWDVPSEAVLASRPAVEIGPSGSVAYRAHTDAEFRRMRCTYYGLVSHIDQQVGRLLDAVNTLGLLDDTVIAVTSDHGDLMGEYGQFQKGMFYDITTRVPCILAGPGVPVRQRVSRLTESIDLAPTLMGLAGVPVPDQFSGRDMLHGEPREDVVGEILRGPGGSIRRSWIRTARWSLDFTSEVAGIPTPPSRPRSKTGAAASGGRDGKLIDLVNDPLAHRNLYGERGYQDVVEALVARFEERTASGRRPIQRGGPPRSVSTG